MWTQVQAGVCSNKVRPTNLSPFGVTGNELEIIGIQEVEFYLNDRKFCHQFCVCSLPTNADGILGMDFLSERNADLNLRKLEIRLMKDANMVHGFVGQSSRQRREEAGRSALTVFVTQNGRHGREGMRGRECERRPPQINLREAESWLVKTTKTVRLAPRAKQIVIGKVETPKRLAVPELVCVEPAQLPLEGVLVARGLSRAFTKGTEQARECQAMTPVMSRDDQLRSTQSSVYVHVMLANFSHEEIELPKASILGIAEETSASVVATINDGENENSSCVAQARTGVNTVVSDAAFKQYLQEKLGHLTHAERTVIEPYY